jgi:hypothetical protein
MRTFRWAAELAVSADVGRAELGVSQLEALGDSGMLDRDQQFFVAAAVAVVYRDMGVEVQEGGA